MKLLDRLFGRKAAQLTYDQVADLIDGVGGGNVAGMVVNDKTALQVATVMACVKVLADGCATPDLHVFRELDDGSRQKAVNIPEYRLLSRRPNEWQTSLEWRRMMTAHAALTGSALSIKTRGGNGRVRELIPVPPGNWEVRRVSTAWASSGVVPVLIHLAARSRISGRPAFSAPARLAIHFVRRFCCSSVRLPSTA